MLPHANPTVIFQKLEDGAVLFAPETEVYFGLNEVGAAIWQLLVPRERSLDEICSDLAQRYPEVAATTIRSDVIELLDQLVDEGLARRADPRGPDAASDP
jgi:hypothetical protein